jgi:hypothetical protein
MTGPRSTDPDGGKVKQAVEKVVDKVKSAIG